FRRQGAESDLTLRWRRHALLILTHSDHLETAGLDPSEPSQRSESQDRGLAWTLSPFRFQVSLPVLNILSFCHNDNIVSLERVFQMYYLVS
uniref:Uncharacterized protein n=1 Tax=Lates calcarifer TaxID=8187 RepID=A0A4W6DH08_LATCA